MASTQTLCLLIDRVAYPPSPVCAAALAALGRVGSGEGRQRMAACSRGYARLHSRPTDCSAESGADGSLEEDGGAHGAASCSISSQRLAPAPLECDSDGHVSLACDICLNLHAFDFANDQTDNSDIPLRSEAVQRANADRPAALSSLYQCEVTLLPVSNNCLPLLAAIPIRCGSEDVAAVAPNTV